MSDSGIMASMKTELRYKQIIDLEYLLHQDKERDALHIHQRDREIYLKNFSDHDESPDSPKTLLKLWVNERIANNFARPEQKSPGTIFEEVRRLASIIAITKGLAAGVIAGLVFFSYSGSTPINVFHFLLFFVVSQLFLVAILVSTFLLHRMLPGVKWSPFYTFIAHSVFQKFLKFLHKQWLTKLDSGKRLSVEHALGLFKSSNRLYGSIFHWPLFLFAQLVGIGFNLGLVTITALKVTTSDLAFGWQSTLQVSAEAIYAFAKTFALPWSAILPSGTSSPTLVAIEGSRIILKEGIYHLVTTDLIAWWPFLICSLIFYGLFLRLAFWGIGKFMERRSLCSLKFDSPGCLNILRRMQTPLVRTQAAPEPQIERSKTEDPLPLKTVPDCLPTTNPTPLVALIPDDIYSLCGEGILAPYLSPKGLDIRQIFKFMENYDEDQRLITSLKEHPWTEEEELFIIMEGWMVPLVDFLSYLKELRKVLPLSTIIHLGLVGRPENGRLSTVNHQDFDLWKKKITPGGDPYLSLFSLIP